MRNIIGQPARGDDFYPRIKEVNRISQSLANGNNIQVAAPRRVGKTSILWYLLDNNIESRIYVYLDTESISEEATFYKKVLAEIIKNKNVTNLKKLRKNIEDKSNGFLKKLKSITVLGNGIELNHEKGEQDYYNELNNFLMGYAQTEDKELVLLVDEFPQTVENIKKIDEQAAIKFLQGNRELRINPELNGKVKFIYTGSIGLNYTVSKLNSTATINDLNSIEIGALDIEDAKNLFTTLVSSRKRVINSEACDYLMKKIEWLIPFHIQLIVQEVLDQTKDQDEITPKIIENAIEGIISLRHQNHFEHYNSRLKTQFKGEQFKYAEDILKQIAENDSLNKNQLFDIAIRYKQEDEYKRIIETLMYDGYINNSTNNTEYRFNSPLVQLWWLKFIC